MRRSTGRLADALAFDRRFAPGPWTRTLRALALAGAFTSAREAVAADCQPQATPPPAEAGSVDPMTVDPDLRDEATQAPSAAPPPSSAAESLGRTPGRVKCLDESLVDEFGRAKPRKGVQPRDFRKARRLALSIGGGAFGGDLLDTQWQVDGNLAFWFVEDFGLAADFKLVPMTYRIERAPTEAVTGENRYPDGVVDNLAYVLMGHLMWSPIHTKLRAGEDRIIHGDFVLFGGAGPVWHRSTQGVGFDVGMSLYLYPNRFVSIRFDISDLILAQELLGSRRISNNLLFNVGVGLWIPFRLRG